MLLNISILKNVKLASQSADYDYDMAMMIIITIIITIIFIIIIIIIRSSSSIIIIVVFASLCLVRPLGLNTFITSKSLKAILYLLNVCRALPNLKLPRPQLQFKNLDPNLGQGS